MITITTEIEHLNNAHGEYLRATLRRSDKPELIASIESADLSGHKKMIVSEDAYKQAVTARFFSEVGRCIQQAVSTP